MESLNPRNLRTVTDGRGTRNNFIVGRPIHSLSFVRTKNKSADSRLFIKKRTRLITMKSQPIVLRLF